MIETIKEWQEIIGAIIGAILFAMGQKEGRFGAALAGAFVGAIAGALAVYGGSHTVGQTRDAGAVILPALANKAQLGTMLALLLN